PILQTSIYKTRQNFAANDERYTIRGCLYFQDFSAHGEGSASPTASRMMASMRSCSLLVVGVAPYDAGNQSWALMVWSSRIGAADSFDP
ncbi:MAG TPA: hypothetical protein PLZ95_22840, partial [Bryobacteraceae bacterium]|nr:hypothetical protein [Bryobacteraceae bacterium]